MHAPISHSPSSANMAMSFDHTNLASLQATISSPSFHDFPLHDFVPIKTSDIFGNLLCPLPEHAITPLPTSHIFGNPLCPLPEHGYSLTPASPDPLPTSDSFTITPTFEPSPDSFYYPSSSEEGFVKSSAYDMHLTNAYNFFGRRAASIPLMPAPPAPPISDIPESEAYESHNSRSVAEPSNSVGCVFLIWNRC